MCNVKQEHISLRYSGKEVVNRSAGNTRRQYLTQSLQHFGKYDKFPYKIIISGREYDLSSHTAQIHVSDMCLFREQFQSIDHRPPLNRLIVIIFLGFDAVGSGF